MDSDREALIEALGESFGEDLVFWNIFGRSGFEVLGSLLEPVT